MSDTSTGQLQNKPVFSKRKPSNLKKRASEDQAEDDGQEGSAVVRKQKTLAGTPAVHATTKKVAEQKEDSDIFSYKSTRQMTFIGDSLATATLETETPMDRDARAIAERNIQIAKDLASGEPTDKVYRGLGGYGAVIEKSEGAVHASKYTGSLGPVRAPTNVRQTCRFDYQPDICKDYTETGFCGYGDSCKFMHDRGDYKSGWQIEKEWEIEQKAKRQAAEAKTSARLRRTAAGGNPDADEEDEENEGLARDEDGLPFACFICRGPFKDPIVTRCNHYFCSTCALDHSMRSVKCAACNQPHSGIFNRATKLIEKLAAQKIASQQAKSLEDEKAEGGEDDDDDISQITTKPASGQWKAVSSGLWQIPG